VLEIIGYRDAKIDVKAKHTEPRRQYHDDKDALGRLALMFEGMRHGDVITIVRIDT
jgi:hypothetical protein